MATASGEVMARRGCPGREQGDGRRRYQPMLCPMKAATKRTPETLDDAINRGLIRARDIFPYQSCTMALPPTSSIATLAGRRATVAQIPTANPIVVVPPRVAVTTHYLS